MLSDSAHLAAKIQRDLLHHASGDGSSRRNSLLGGGSTGVPTTIQLDRSASSMLYQISSTVLSLDLLGLSPAQSSSSVPFDGALRDSVSYALSEMSKCLETAAPELKKVRSSSAVPQTVQATCDLLDSLSSAIHAVNNRLLHAVIDVEPAPSHRSARAESSLRSHSRTSAETTNVVLKSSRVAQFDKQLDEVRILRSEVRRMKEREDLLLKKVRDLEIDCRVKAHTVASTSASAQAVFDENTILRQIAEHNQSLLREVDALYRCVAENETLNLEISNKQKTIDSLINKNDELKAEVRKKAQQ